MRSGSICSATTSCGTPGHDTPPEDASTVAGDILSAGAESEFVVPGVLSFQIVSRCFFEKLTRLVP